MAYSGGRGVNFRPVGYTAPRNVPSDRAQYVELETRMSRLLDEMRGLKEANLHVTNENCPPLSAAPQPVNATAYFQDFSRPPPPFGPPPVTYTNVSHQYTNQPAPPQNYQTPVYNGPIQKLIIDPIQTDYFKTKAQNYLQNIQTYNTYHRDRNAPTNRNYTTNQTRRTNNQQPVTNNFNRTIKPNNQNKLEHLNGAETAFRFLQMSHHRRNWTTLPPSLSKRVDEFTNDIKPPLPTDNLQQALRAAADEYRNKIKTVVADHFVTQLTTLEESLQKTNTDNKNTAISSAKERILIKCPRINKNSLNSDIDRLYAIYGLLPAATVEMEHTTCGEIEVCVTNIRDTVVPNTVNVPFKTVSTSKLPRSPRSKQTQPIDKPEIALTNRFQIFDTLDQNDCQSPQKRKLPHTPKNQEPTDSQSPHTHRIDKKPNNNRTPIHESSQNTNSQSQSSSQSDIVPSASQTNITYSKDTLTISLDPRVSTLIIGDSNLKNISTDFFEDTTYLFYVPGLNHATTTAFIQNIPVPNNLTDIIITTGINDRNNAIPNLKKVFNALDRLKVRKHFLEIGYNAEKFTKNQARYLDNINQIARDEPSVNFIRTANPIHTAQDGVHYLPETNFLIGTILYKYIEQGHFLDSMTSPNLTT